MEKRVAVIGAGPSGLAVLHAFEAARREGADVPDVVCFEKQSDWGGLWNYSWRTGVGDDGEPVHGSLDRHFRANRPKECTEFADYSFEEHFGRPIPSYPPRAAVLDYIAGRAERNGVRAFIRFATPVRWVAWSGETGRFSVTVEDLAEDRHETQAFDHVIVASGHFSAPDMPHFPGIEAFPGRVMHARDFRGGDEFAGQRLLLVGKDSSAEDIGLQVRKYGARSVTLSGRTVSERIDWPDGVWERPLLAALSGQTATFSDGSQEEVDAIVLCTGYRHHFPFLSDELRLRTANRLYPPGLYKGVFWRANPQLSYLGMQDQIFTFNMFDAQAFVVRDGVLGRLPSPSAEEGDADMALWRTREEALTTPFEAIAFQADYVRDLLAMTDYPFLDVDAIAALFEDHERHKAGGILTYRDRSHASTLTGTIAPRPPVPWSEARDDSLEAFLAAAPAAG